MSNQSMAWLRVGWLVLSCLFVGCRVTDGERVAINSAALPVAYRAANNSVAPPIDLSVLARRSLDSDLIYPGDLLDLTLLTGAETESPEPLPYRVSPAGTLDLPVVGPVKVAGLTLTAAEEEVRKVSIERRVYRSPTVSLQVNSRESDRVRVVGAVKEPGVYELPRAGSDLLAALTAAGGLSEEAGYSIELRHPFAGPGVRPASYQGGVDSGPAEQSVHVDLLEAMSGNTGDLRLRDGSVVMVGERQPETVYVNGLVKQAGEYELPRSKPLRVTQAIALAGGREIEFADKVHVQRYLKGRSEPILIEVSLDEAKSNADANLVLMAGDVVSVEETPTTFTVDFLRNFFRIGFSSAIPGF